MSVSNSFCQIHGCQLEDDGTCIVCTEEGRTNLNTCPECKAQLEADGTCGVCKVIDDCYPVDIVKAEWQEREI